MCCVAQGPVFGRVAQQLLARTQTLMKGARHQRFDPPNHRHRRFGEIVFQSDLVFELLDAHLTRCPVSGVRYKSYGYTDSSWVTGWQFAIIMRRNLVHCTPYTGHRKPRTPDTALRLKSRLPLPMLFTGMPGSTTGSRSMARCEHERGVVLPSVLMLLAVLSVVTGASLTATLMDLKISGYYAKSVVAFYIAEAGANRGLYELSDEDGHYDLASISAPTVVFEAEGLNGGSYRVVASPAEESQFTLRSIGCYPAADPCPRSHTTSTVQLLVESNPEATDPEQRVRVVAWKEIY